MIAETSLIKKMSDFFSRLFQSNKEKKEQDAILLQESYDLLKELERAWDSPTAERIDLVDYTNLLIQKAHDIRLRKNRAIAHQIKAFAQRNCLAGVIPDSEMERVHKETKELLEMMNLEDR
jgi:hypothetical protein